MEVSLKVGDCKGREPKPGRRHGAGNAVSQSRLAGKGDDPFIRRLSGEGSSGAWRLRALACARRRSV
ncbi:hypothetical protein KCP75_05375 [Salmonella enterica subsp. enterica]|nr:hypothetical protein KCP75_05375 [Salmonella enterica subsp. enterica]